MMEGAFFVGRGELLAWINDLLKLNLTKIEQMASGAVYIQLMDTVYPTSVPMGKVNWMAKHEHEFVNNYKILQQIFDRNSVTKHIEVEKLIKGKYQDNLEFTQWMKRFVDLNGRGGEYNAIERRRGAKTPWDSGDRKAMPAAKPRNPPPKPAPRVTKPAAPAGREDSGKVSELTAQVTELTMATDTLEKERDFYFGKLRAIELFCESYSDSEHPIIQQLLKVLYATDDETVTVNEDGSVTVSPAEPLI